MNWAQFKDLASHMCLAGAVVASWSLTQLGGRFEHFYSLNSVKTFKKM